MLTFKSDRDIDHRGQEWSSQFTIDCPFCSTNLGFYTQLKNNECYSCREVLPFQSKMVKMLKERIAYHVQNDTDENACKQTNSSGMQMQYVD